MSGGEIIELTQVMRDLITTLNESMRATESASSHTEQRNILSNNAVENIDYQATLWRGKGFGRGCRGFIQTFEVFARNQTATNGTITLGFKAFPEATDEQFTATITVPGGVQGREGAWHSVNVGRAWNYWGMFVYVTAITGGVEYAYDNAEVSTPEPTPNSDAWTSADLGTSWLGEDNRRYWFRVNQYFQTLGEIGVGGHVTILEVDKYLRVVLTDESGNITGIPVPLFAMSIIGSDETYFNTLADGGERQKSYSAGDPFTSDWIVGRSFYPYSVTIILRSERATSPRPPCLLEYEGVYIAITASDGQRIFTASLGQDRNIDWDRLTIDGTEYWTGIYRSGQEEIQYRNIASDVSLTVLVKNSSGIQLDAVEIYILGSSHPIA